MDQHEDVWLVQLQNGAVRVMTLDELDAAFQEGAIDEETFVRRDGTSKWIRLREELGGDEPVAAAPAPSPTPAPVSYGAVPAYPMPSQQPLYSTRPVVSEIDDSELDFDAPFKKSRKGLYAGLGIGAVALVALAIVSASKLGAAPAADVNASVVNAVQPPPQVVIPPPPPVDPQPAQKLSDDQKKALSSKDSQFNKRQDALRRDRERYTPPTRHKTQPPPFTKNGSAYDPLNAKL
jgi:hypothetical protein